MNSNWSYTQNVFNNATKGNFKRMLLMSRDHHDKLKVEATTKPAIDALYQSFLPFFTNFTSIYSEVMNNASTYSSSTLRVEMLFQELSSKKAKRWDIMIQNEYDDSTIEYNDLFGNGRARFQAGAYDMRIAALVSFSNKLAIYPNLVAVKTEVDALFTQIDTARTTQQGNERLDANVRNQLENARVELAVAMHRVFGGLINLYAHNTKDIENYYEMKYVQSPTRSNTTSNNSGGGTSVSVAANGRAILLNGNFTDSTAFVINNTGGVDLGVFATNDPQAAIPADLTFVSANSVGSFAGDELSDGATSFQYLIAVNLNGTAGKAEAWTEVGA